MGDSTQNIRKRTYEDGAYAKRTVGRHLMDCLHEVARIKPEDPIEYIAHWLYRSHDSEMYFHDQIQFLRGLRDAYDTSLAEKARKEEKLQPVINAIAEEKERYRNACIEERNALLDYREIAIFDDREAARRIRDLEVIIADEETVEEPIPLDEKLIQKFRVASGRPATEKIKGSRRARRSSTFGPSWQRLASQPWRGFGRNLQDPANADGIVPMEYQYDSDDIITDGSEPELAPYLSSTSSVSQDGGPVPQKNCDITDRRPSPPKNVTFCLPPLVTSESSEERQMSLWSGNVVPLPPIHVSAQTEEQSSGCDQHFPPIHVSGGLDELDRGSDQYLEFHHETLSHEPTNEDSSMVSSVQRFAGVVESPQVLRQRYTQSDTEHEPQMRGQDTGVPDEDQQTDSLDTSHTLVTSLTLAESEDLPMKLWEETESDDRSGSGESPPV